jgi:hypothetical protein
MLVEAVTKYRVVKGKYQLQRHGTGILVTC